MHFELYLHYCISLYWRRVEKNKNIDMRYILFGRETLLKMNNNIMFKIMLQNYEKMLLPVVFIKTGKKGLFSMLRYTYTNWKSSPVGTILVGCFEYKIRSKYILVYLENCKCCFHFPSIWWKVELANCDQICHELSNTVHRLIRNTYRYIVCRRNVNK